MAIKKLESGKWQADIRPDGKTRKRKTFRTKAEALRWVNTLSTQAINDQDWNKSRSDQRTLNEYATIWQSLHGINLKDKTRLQQILNTSERLGNPVAQELDAKTFLAYRSTRIEAGITPNTVNHELAYLNGVYNFLISVGECQTNPLAQVKRLKHNKFEAEYLSTEQIDTLIAELRKSMTTTWLCALLGFSTGGRWSEVTNLDMRHIKPNHVKFVNTKSSKSRIVPINEQLYKTLLQHNHSDVLRGSYTVFRKGITRAKIRLPKGQLSHVMRHTFASHFMMNGGDILTLQKLLGHSSLQMTMVYAHLAPDILDKAKHLNPIAHSDIMNTTDRNEQYNNG